ncbi:MAG: sugar ABC transporter substrate-binding protein [Blastococcus sp.]
MKVLGTRRKSRGGVAGMVVLALSLTLSACGGGASGAQGGKVDQAFVDAAQQRVEAAYAGTDRPLPQSAPKPEKGKNVWLIACSMAAPGCAQPVLAMQKAGTAMGWNMKVVDAKFDFSYYPTVIRQAIAAKPDAIVLQAIDCPTVQQPLREAKAAGIPVYSSTSFDCDDPSVHGEKLFSGSTPYGKSGNIAEFLQGLGALAADTLIARSHGKADVVEVHEVDALYDAYVGKGFEARMNECKTCVYTRAEVTGADYGDGGVQAKTAATLARRPQANGVMAPIDALVSLGAGAAVKASGRNGLDFVTVGGAKPTIDMIRAGGPLTLGVGLPLDWLGWATIDGVNRMLHGQPDVDQGIGTQLYDAKKNLATSPVFYDGNVDANGKARVDYQAHYKQIWGVG